MSCSSGISHTVTLSEDGTLYTFGNNSYGQLGFINNCNCISSPTQIFGLPKIKIVSCGNHFTVCVDFNGIMMSFGANPYGQLGTGDTKNYNLPQVIKGLPRVQSISCGRDYTLILTKDKNLWSCGYNLSGQLCLGNKEHQFKPQKTSFSNILKISGGNQYSLFQNTKGELFISHPKCKAELIPKQPQNISQFCSGNNGFSLFLAQGLVFCFEINVEGYNCSQIVDIPSIRTISCVGESSYLIDHGGNVWSFGRNLYGQLGYGDRNNRDDPTKIISLQDIIQISNSSFGNHLFAKDSQNKTFVFGCNKNGQLGFHPNELFIPIPKMINCTIWGSSNCQGYNKIENFMKEMSSEATMNWTREEVKKLEMLQSRIIQVNFNLQLDNNCKMKQEFPRNSFESWNEVYCFLNEKFKLVDSKVNQKQENQTQITKNRQTLEAELNEIENTIEQLQIKKKQILDNLTKTKLEEEDFEENFIFIEENHRILNEMCTSVAKFCNNENEMKNELEELFKRKKFTKFDCKDISKLLWKMDLAKYQQIFEDNQIDGNVALMMTDDWTPWEQIVIEKRDYYYMLFNFELMQTPGYLQTLSPDYDPDCCVCSHNTPEKTINLLEEYDILIDSELILKNNYCAPVLIPLLKDILGNDFLSPKGRKIMEEISKWKKYHKKHLKDLTIGIKRKLNSPEGKQYKKQKLIHDHE